DEAATPIAAGTAPFTGRFRPQEALSGFDGLDANGVWRLELRDDSDLTAAGTLNAWSIQFTCTEPATLTDTSGAYAFTNLPPGDYSIAEQRQEGWEQTAPVPVPPGVYLTTLASGDVAVGRDFGNAPCAVTNTRDSGPGSLRAAIEYANMATLPALAV